jgi:cbb3-type cytochrome oxidase subunit 3
MLHAIAASVFMVVAYSTLVLGGDFLSQESQVVLGIIALAAVAWAFAPERKR